MRLNRRELRNMILKEMEEPTLPGMGGFDRMSGRPDAKLINTIMQRLDRFIRTTVSSLQSYNGDFRGLQMGHIKALIDATKTLKECERGNIDKDWVTCAQDVLEILKFISNLAKSNEIDGINNILRVPVDKGGIIPLLDLSIQQANR